MRRHTNGLTGVLLGLFSTIRTSTYNALQIVDNGLDENFLHNHLVRYPCKISDWCTDNPNLSIVQNCFKSDEGHNEDLQFFGEKMDAIVNHFWQNHFFLSRYTNTGLDNLFGMECAFSFKGIACAPNRRSFSCLSWWLNYASSHHAIFFSVRISCKPQSLMPAASRIGFWRSKECLLLQVPKKTIYDSCAVEWGIKTRAFRLPCPLLNQDMRLNLPSCSFWVWLLFVCQCIF